MQEQIFKSVLSKDDLSWQSLIYELIKTNQIDPWDVNVSLLTKKYIEIIKKMKEMDFHVSGKVVLAAAVLLKIKSSRLVTDDMNALDSLFAQSHESDEDEGFDELDEMDMGQINKREEGDPLKLIPRTPQPRRRKVTIYDLMDALQKAMEVKKRRVMRQIPDDVTIKIPKKKIDITQVIREVFGTIKLHFFKQKQALTFNQLLSDKPDRDEKIFTFIPLLHLSNARKIDIEQKEHFGNINIYMGGKGPKLDWDPDEESAMHRIKEKRKAERARLKAAKKKK